MGLGNFERRIVATTTRWTDIEQKQEEEGPEALAEYIAAKYYDKLLSFAKNKI